MDTRVFSVFVNLLLALYEGVRCCSEKIPHGTVQANCKDICIYSCDQGYEAALPSRLVKCGFHGTWEPFSAFSEFMTDLCRAKSCPPIAVPNGALSACSRYVDDTCWYHCNEGYTQNALLLTCLTTTEWDSNLHTLCTNDAQCPSFKVENGDLDYSCNRNPGDVCTYTCHEGTLPIDSSRIVSCGPNGTWDKPLDSLCKFIQCPETIPGAVISPECERTYNEKCYFYKCSAGYEKTPTQLYLKCNGSAQWEVHYYGFHIGKELCIEEGLMCPATIENGHIRSRCIRKVGAKCEFLCNKYCSVNRRVGMLTCQSDKTWAPKERLCWNCFTPTTAKPACPSTIPGGRIEIGCDRLPGTVCDIYCDEGCSSNRYSLYCNTWGRWDDASKACYCYESDYGSESDTTLGSEADTGMFAGFIAGGVGFCVLLYICVVACRKNEQGNQEQNGTPAGATPVTYHQVATSVQPTDGQRYNQPTYCTPGGQANPQPLLPGAQTTRNTREWRRDRASPIAGPVLTATAPDITESTSADSEQYPPPPSYNEVITQPEKYKT